MYFHGGKSGRAPWTARSSNERRPRCHRFDLDTKSVGTERKLTTRRISKTLELIVTNTFRTPSYIPRSARAAELFEANVWSHEAIGSQPGERRIATPAIVARTLHHSCSHRIEINVAASSQHMLVPGYQARLVAALPQGACALRCLIHVLDISRPERLHQLRHPAHSQRRDEQMNVVRHQRVRVHEHAVAQRCVGQRFQVHMEVPFAEEARLAIVSTLHYMQREIGQQKARAAGHRASERADRSQRSA